MPLVGLGLRRLLWNRSLLAALNRVTLSHHRKPYPAHSVTSLPGFPVRQRLPTTWLKHHMLGQMSLPAFIQQVRLASQAITDNAVSVQQPYFTSPAAPSQPPAASEQPASVQAQFYAAAFQGKSNPRLRGSGVCVGA